MLKLGWVFICLFIFNACEYDRHIRGKTIILEDVDICSQAEPIIKKHDKLRNKTLKYFKELDVLAEEEQTADVVNRMTSLAEKIFKVEKEIQKNLPKILQNKKMGVQHRWVIKIEEDISKEELQILSAVGLHSKIEDNVLDSISLESAKDYLIITLNRESNTVEACAGEGKYMLILEGIRKVSNSKIRRFKWRLSAQLGI